MLLAFAEIRLDGCSPTEREANSITASAFPSAASCEISSDEVKGGMDNGFLELGFGRGKVAAAISKSNATRLGERSPVQLAR
ncbi:hypothetical protein AFLA70_38g004642 [Aspergillus flavus AF70]|nr:hypothetical protein AFLA70_38g004642 [Aspergillus flavus AF70]